MKVLFFSTDYWPDPGGIAAHVYYLSRALARAGVEMTVVGGHRTQHMEAMRDDIGAVSFNEYRIRRRGPTFIRGGLFLLRAIGTVRNLSTQAWDVAHFHNFLLDGLVMGIVDFPTAQIRIFTNHGDTVLQAFDRGKRVPFHKLLVHSVDGIITPSRELREKSSILSGSNRVIRYIPNGVDTVRFIPGDPLPGRKLLGLAEDQVAIIAVRRHDPKCGLPWLIQAVPYVVKKHPEAVFFFIGDGEQTPLLVEMVKDLRLENAVRFLGRMSHEILPHVYRAAYVSVLPSLYEAVSLSGLESLASGVPVIGTDVGGIPEFVRPRETGWLVPPRSSDALANAIIEALDAPDVRGRMGKRGRELVIDEFSWDKVAQKTIDFYRELGAT